MPLLGYPLMLVWQRVRCRELSAHWWDEQKRRKRATRSRVRVRLARLVVQIYPLGTLQRRKAFAKLHGAVAEGRGAREVSPRPATPLVLLADGGESVISKSRK